jgi:hypothetical protein
VGESGTVQIAFPFLKPVDRCTDGRPEPPLGIYFFIDPAIARSRCALDRARLCLPFAIDAFSSADNTVTVCFGACLTSDLITFPIFPPLPLGSFRKLFLAQK